MKTSHFHFGALSLCLLATSLLTGCFRCENTVKQQIVSPDGMRKAVVFSRDCGATTGPNLQISILDASSPLPDDQGNAFVGDSGGPVAIAWESPTRLRITYSDTMRVFREDSSVAGATVVYQRGRKP